LTSDYGILLHQDIDSAMVQLVGDLEISVRQYSTVVEILCDQSAIQPGAEAFTFLVDGENQAVTWTYRDLEWRARAIAAQLQALSLSGERALLLYPPGLDYLAAFFGCLYAGVIAVPAYPPRNGRNTPRILSILKDAQVAIVLTTSTAVTQIQSLVGAFDSTTSLKWLTTDNLALDIAASWQEPFINQETLAFLQYTSGSTGTPKGVMVTHGNLLHNATATYLYMEHSPSSKFVTWLPIYHDMGLIGGVLQPLYGGFPCIMMPPALFLQRPYLWLQAISKYGGTTSGAPNFAYELCTQKITPEQRSKLDLSSWSVAFNGAEPIRHQSLELFAQTFSECGFRKEAFYPCYGMAEATLMVSGSVKTALPKVKTVEKSSLESNRIVDVISDEEDSLCVVSCGRSLPQQQLAIVNPETLTRCAASEVGEVWVSSPSIGKGYWNRPEETQQTFGAYLQDTGEGPFLRTGDLGFLDSSELFITGRAKDLIIIRGRNLYPQDIELTSECAHRVLRKGSSAAFAIEVDGEERVVIVQEVEFRAKPNVEEVTTAICAAVSEAHELQVYGVVLIKAGTIPKTSSGKIQRRATKAQFLTGSLDVLSSCIFDVAVEEAKSLTREELLSVDSQLRLGTVESYLQSLVAWILQVNISQLDSKQPLIRLGLDSLKVFELKNRVEQDLRVVVPVADLFADVSIAELAKQILDKITYSLPVGSANISNNICVIERKHNNHPLSFAQQRLWFMNQLQPGNAAYHIPIAIEIKGNLDVAILGNCINEIINRHEILRTSFEIVNGEPVQRIASGVTIAVPELNLRHLSGQEQHAEIQKLSLEEVQLPFDLGQAPLLRVKILHVTTDKSILLMTLHHIIADGWSIKILIRELSTLYQAFSTGNPSPLPELPIQYIDFVSWQRKRLQGEVVESHLAYWKHQLSGQLPVLELPTDYPRQAVQTYRGAQQKFRLTKSLSKKIKQLSQKQGATLFMTLLAAFNTLLYRYTSQDDIIVGSPIANRNNTQVESLIGCFVNTLVLRTNVDGNPSFQELIERVRKVAIDAYIHQDLPFEKLVELQPNRDLSYHPLFQVMFVLQDSQLSNVNCPSLNWKTVELDSGTAKFDIFLSMIDSEQGLMGTLEYNTDLFNPDTVIRMVEHFQTLLQAIVLHPNECISRLPLLTPAQRQTLFVEWNDTQVDYPQVCVHNLFEQQVEKTPDNIALVFENQQLTYRELNQGANKLARYLQQLGVKADVMVGICMERSVEMVVGILAIMKAGGAYVPLDSNYPKERLAFMLADSQVSVLLTQRDLVNQLPPHQAQVVFTDGKGKDLSYFCQENLVTDVKLQNLAYVIYTSGSTGLPKGAMNTHQGLCNRLLWMQDTYKLTSSDRVLQKTPFSFDVSVWEFFLPLLTGASLVVAKPGGHQDANYLVELIAASKITTLHFVPSMLQVFLEEPGLERCESLKRVICSGEALPLDLQKRFFEKLKAELHNLYGPTEASIDVTAWQCQKDSNDSCGRIPIGRPIANTQIYILDKHLQPVPIGVPGELYIGGIGLARGYWNRPELTEAKFIPSPFTDEQRLYKTGDLARFRSDGNIEFLGRVDYQVKIRGFRIEIGEIEAVLAQHPQVRETVVVAKEDISNQNQRRLVAYIVPTKQANPLIEELRSFLKEKLPEYMLPLAFVVLDTFPVTPNGKIDRRALPIPDLRPELSATYQPPQSEVEKNIAQIWRQVLHLDQVSIHDNFFDLGGHSLLLLQVNNTLRTVFKSDISVVTMFQHPTIHSLAQHLNQQISQPQNQLPVFVESQNRAQKQIESIKRQQSFRKQVGR
jgi:amino acid adenylation domain-containing protein